ncbi:hypothetical protein [Marivivens aquimaris]|uniref:hypothetical protein n=1 Tax=Marivivens aquimaris TaxID=2774876 RepID=UPI00187E224B|nr:hypothetical protein [Marivivens aquimaris]
MDNSVGRQRVPSRRLEPSKPDLCDRKLKAATNLHLIARQMSRGKNHDILVCSLVFQAEKACLQN